MPAPGKHELPGSNSGGWDGVTAIIRQIQSQHAGITASPVGASPINRAMLARREEPSKRILELSKDFVPTLDLFMLLDGTGSMGNNDGPVRTDVAPFIIRSLANTFGFIPPEVQQIISPIRRINFNVLTFGDGSPLCGNRRIDEPYLKMVDGGSLVLDTNTPIDSQIEPLVKRIRSYRTSMGGGANNGESSAEALLAALNVTGDREKAREQLALLRALRDDCVSLSRAGGEGDIVNHLNTLIQTGCVPVQAVIHAGRQLETSADKGRQMVFLVTDESAINRDLLTALESIHPPHGLLAIITPQGEEDTLGAHRFWRQHAQSLGAQLFNLYDLHGATPDLKGVNPGAADLNSVISQTAGDTVAQQLTCLLGAGSRGNGIIKP